MPGHKFDPAHHERLNKPERLKSQPVQPLLDLLELKGQEVLLDLGSGTGYFLLPAARMVRRAIGLDVSGEMLGMLIESARSAGAGNIEGLLITEKSIPLPAAAAQAGLCVNVLHEMDRPEDLLSEMRRVLEPGSRFLLADWKKVDTGQGPPLEHRVSGEQARRVLEDSGFTGVDSHPVYENHYVLLGRVPV